MKSQYTWICPHCGSTHHSDGSDRLSEAQPILCPVCHGPVKVSARYFCHKTRGCGGHFCLMLPAVKELKLQPFVCEVCGRQDFASRFVSYQPDITLSEEEEAQSETDAATSAAQQLSVICDGNELACIVPGEKKTFGRGMAADIRLADCDIHVSRVHFGISLSLEGRILLNVEGLNGLMINSGKRIPKGSSVVMQRGDVISLYSQKIELK